MPSAVEQEIRDLIRTHGRITFARFMHICLYSPRGGFYASRAERIAAHFGTSAMSHPAFGLLIARQLEQMWRLLGDPQTFHVIEVGSGEGTLARSILRAREQMDARFARALHYVAVDVEPRAHDARNVCGAGSGIGTDDGMRGVHRVQTAGLGAFRNIVGCILSNELIDNFPVHRFAIEGGRLKEIFVTSVDGKLVEVADEPSVPQIEARLAGLGVSLADGYRGEACLALEDWTSQIVAALERGFVLTIDYGQCASELYSPENSEGTAVCYHRHAARSNPYQDLGEQDITCHVDFTSLMQIGERHGLRTVGYVPQRVFLRNLGFESLVSALEAEDLSEARRTLSRMAMMSLVDPEQYGDLKVLGQTKGLGSNVSLTGFTGERS